VFRKEWGFDSLHGHQPSLLRSYGWQASLRGFGEAAKAARRSPTGEDGLATVKYVYLLESINFPNETYIGLTDDLRARLDAQTRVDRSTRTSTSRGAWSRISRFPITEGRLNLSAI
jgi:hypothetical protein